MGELVSRLPQGSQNEFNVTDFVQNNLPTIINSLRNRLSTESQRMDATTLDRLFYRGLSSVLNRLGINYEDYLQNPDQLRYIEEGRKGVKKSTPPPMKIIGTSRMGNQRIAPSTGNRPLDSQQPPRRSTRIRTPTVVYNPVTGGDAVNIGGFLRKIERDQQGRRFYYDMNGRQVYL